MQPQQTPQTNHKRNATNGIKVRYDICTNKAILSTTKYGRVHAVLAQPCLPISITAQVSRNAVEVDGLRPALRVCLFAVLFVYLFT